MQIEQICLCILDISLQNSTIFDKIECNSCTVAFYFIKLRW